MSLKANFDCKYSLTLRTRTWCSFYVNPNVTLEDSRLRKIVGTHGTVQIIISCVNLIVTLNKNRSRESLLTLLGFDFVSTGRSIL